MKYQNELNWSITQPLGSYGNGSPGYRQNFSATARNSGLGQQKIINPPGLGRTFVRRQGVPAGAYFTYSPVGTTLNPGKKTSKTAEFIFSDGLNNETA